MSNYHVLIQTKEKHEVIVVFHIAVPNENNEAIPAEAIRSLYECIKTNESPDSSLVPDLHTTHETEYQDILDGKIVERQETIKFDAKMTLIQKRNIIDARFNKLKNDVPDEIRNEYQWYGAYRDV